VAQPPPRRCPGRSTSHHPDQHCAARSQLGLAPVRSYRSG
jgi:hypothetical protein